MSLSTNILRISVQEDCFKYECCYPKSLSSSDIKQIQKTIEDLDQLFIYQHPYIYSCKKLELTSVAVYLSKGDHLLASVGGQATVPKSLVLAEICNKLLRSLKFMYCDSIQAGFNAFEDSEQTIPGLAVESVSGSWGLGIAILPMRMVLSEAVEITNCQLFLDYTRGRFYEREEIVRVDKHHSLVSFRNGENVSLKALRKIEIKNVSGYPLASALNKYVNRIKESNESILKGWNIGFDSKFLTLAGKPIHPGSVIFRNSIEKSLNDIVFPVSRNSYNHYLKQFLKDVIFEDNLQFELSLLIPDTLAKTCKPLVYQVDKIGQRMKLGIRVSYSTFPTFENPKEMSNLCSTAIHRQNHLISILIIIRPVQLNKPEMKGYRSLIQFLIESRAYFHVIEFDQEKERDELEVIALRTVALIYTKMKLNPWKMRGIPFGDKPTVICSLDVQQTVNGSLSIAIVATMNSLYSKFTCSHEICPKHELTDMLLVLLKKCLDKFRIAHGLYPKRVLVFRSGIIGNFANQFTTVRDRLSQYYLSIKNVQPHVLTFIKISSEHLLRTYNQSDENNVSYQTVKKITLLMMTELGNKFYIQLEFDKPPLELEVIEIERDPTFLGRVFDLTAKLCYGTVGNSFGHGMGFLDFATKLNTYKEYNLKSWAELLYEGFLMFL